MEQEDLSKRPRLHFSQLQPDGMYVSSEGKSTPLFNDKSRKRLLGRKLIKSIYDAKNLPEDPWKKEWDDE